MPDRREEVIIDAKPHPAFVLERSWRAVVLGVLVWMILLWLSGRVALAGLTPAAWIVLLVGAGRLVVAVLDRQTRRHLLTDRRIASRRGILRTIEHEITLRNVRHTLVARPLLERVLGLGTIGVTSSGTDSIEVVWRGVEDPGRVHDRVRAVIRAATTPGGHDGPIPVIGISGGIGSGKSTLARVFESLGCVVSDSDKSGDAALRRPEVIDAMRARWGAGVLDEDGAPDKRAIAARVFEDRDERAWLESLVHPMIHDERRALIDRVRRDRGARAVIVDAPLLFEAGVDAECDALVFVETPRDIRRARVRETRGWDAEELERRENAQMGLEKKRDRSDYVIVNGGNPDDLPDQAQRILRAIERTLRRENPG